LTHDYIAAALPRIQTLLMRLFVALPMS